MTSTPFHCLAAACLLAGTLAAQADPALAPAGSKATLTVSYRFEAQGRQQDKYDLHEWKVQRSVELAAELVAHKPAALPAMQALDGTQAGKIQQQQAQAIMARCGDDEKCMEREAMKMGAALAGTPQLAQARQTGRETAAVMQPGAGRYQLWEGRSQNGRYSLDESWHVVHADPICTRLPKARCTHDMARKGSGELPASPGTTMLEVDAQGGTMTLMLPVPLVPLAHVETHRSDEPDGTHEVATPRGPVNGVTVMRLTADGKATQAPMTVALKGGWRSQSGEQVIAMGSGGWHGSPGGAGRLVVRWQFSAR
ncbi:hypothetical protein [Pseudorhodoferax sp.]|uniref:hypothetical protein n=1 Tax=Pseudorhodoferax sp. TaxID=1993553 RepID=UPI002DD668AE|nr:hypothetical protein [Pseudorhodoferax sp.]